MASFCEHYNEPSDFLEGGKILDQLNKYDIIKMLVT